MGANVKLADSMSAATKTMTSMNQLLKPQDVAQNMQNFEKAAAQLNMSEEIGELALIFYTPRRIVMYFSNLLCYTQEYLRSVSL